MKKKPVIIISGATATGKTSSSILIAQNFSDVEIVNFDSLLFFKELNIGTAKPTHLEISSCPHHMLDIMTINEEMNASQYCKMVLPIIKDIHSRSKIPLLVGGSAFYIRALIKGMYDAPKITDEAQQIIAKLRQEEGIVGIRKSLKELDPTSYDNIHENDDYRSTRALEFFLSTSTKLSDQKSKFDENNPYDFSQSIQTDWSILHLYMSIEKQQHWSIMLKRTKQMLNDGLIKEVESILKNHDYNISKPLQSIGYKETVEYLEKLSTDSPMSKEDLIEKIFIATRKLAKSQKTFFKKITPKVNVHPQKDKDSILRECTEFLSSFS